FPGARDHRHADMTLSATERGLHRTLRDRVNVFFDFGPRGTYTMTAMASPPDAPKPTLADLRAEIDRIDEAMHRLLMERGDIIDTLIATKKTAESGSAFRPAREADMMKRLVERHHGLLPLDTVESIWRVIIATFTYVQAPFSVHADLSPGDAAMRDSARFHFGFTVPFISHIGASGVVVAIAASRGDIGLVPASIMAGA